MPTKTLNIFRFLITLLVFTSCRERQDPFVESRLKTAEKFIECLKNNTPDKILEYTYPEVDYNINDKESREFHVSQAYELIKKFGVPPKNKWIIKYDPQNNFERLLITIPIFKGYDTTLNLLQANLIIVFPPPQISDKIFHYEIASENDDDRAAPTLAPQPIDTSRAKN